MIYGPFMGGRGGGVLRDLSTTSPPFWPPSQISMAARARNPAEISRSLATWFRPEVGGTHNHCVYTAIICLDEVDTGCYMNVFFPVCGPRRML